MNYTDIIYAIVNSTNCKLYLELGCQFAITTRRMIAQNRKVVGVDIKQQFGPGDFFFFYEETTDKFFEHFNEYPDIIFIDADHSFEGVKKDFINSLKVLRIGGTILIHDTDPNDEKLLSPDYCNDSYKIIDWIKENYPELDVLVLPADDPGLTLVRRSSDRRINTFNKPMKNYWEHAHIINDLGALSDSHANMIWNDLNILNYFKSGTRVLNIGVGTGICTKEKVSNGLIVDVLDISKQAINKVADIVQREFLSENLNTLPENEYDIILSHLVSMHIDDEELSKQLKYGIKSLKDDGIFAMQFSFYNQKDLDNLYTRRKAAYDNDIFNNLSDDGKNPTLDLTKFQNIYSQQHGYVFRSLDRIKELVKQNGGEITWESEIRRYDWTLMKVQYVHIKKLKNA